VADQCKFLHDRGDYKSGWQLEKEWDAEQARKRKKLEDSVQTFMGGGEADVSGSGIVTGNDDGEENYEIDVPGDGDGAETLPFACFICRASFTNPIVTLCRHYFCYKCAVSHAKKSSLCFVCKKPTNGVFNAATKLLKKISKAGSGGNSYTGTVTESSLTERGGTADEIRVGHAGTAPLGSGEGTGVDSHQPILLRAFDREDVPTKSQWEWVSEK